MASRLFLGVFSVETLKVEEFWKIGELGRPGCPVIERWPFSLVT